MFKTLFPHAKITDQKKSQERKMIIHAYNKAYIQQMRIHRETRKPCSFFVMAGNGPVLLGMQDCEGLQLLSMNYYATNDDTRKTNSEETRQVQEKQQCFK